MRESFSSGEIIMLEWVVTDRSVIKGGWVSYLRVEASDIGATAHRLHTAGRFPPSIGASGLGSGSCCQISAAGTTGR